MAFAAALGILLAMPLSSLGAGISLQSVTTLVPKVTGTVQSTVQKATSVSAPSAPRSSNYVASKPASKSAAAPQATSSTYTPPMYSTNPHGQGTVAGVSLSPSSTVPYTYAPGGSGGEIAVVGRGRSEQNGNGTYHAHTTILALFGHEILGVDATQGQSQTGPLNALQTGVLDPLCVSSGGMVCLALLTADTAASSSGASTDFSVANGSVGGAHGVSFGAAQSSSSINQTSSCQTSSGSSNVANANINGGPLAGVGQSNEGSSACSGQAPSQTASSSVISLGGTGVPLPASGCANGTPNTVFTLAGLLTTICNADSTTQAAAPSGVREALTAIVVPAAGALAKATIGDSESHAVAPASRSTCTGSSCPTTGTGKHESHGNGNGNGGKVNGASGNHNESEVNGTGATGVSIAGEHAEEAALTSTATAKTLPFTGEDVLLVLLVGLGLAAAGLATARRVAHT